MRNIELNIALWKVFIRYDNRLIYLLIKIVLLGVLLLAVQQWSATRRRYLYWWIKIRVRRLQSKMLYFWAWIQLKITARRRYWYLWVKIKVWRLQSILLYFWQLIQLEIVYNYIWYKIITAAYLKVRRQKFIEEWYKIYKLYWAKNRTYIIDQLGYIWVFISWNFQKNYILYIISLKRRLTYFSFRDRATQKWYSLRRKR